MFFNKRKAEARRAEARREEARRLELYRERLEKIDASALGRENLGPQEWNIRQGQAEFLGRTTSGDFPDDYVVVEVEGIPTQDPAREESDEWLNLSEEEFLQRISGFWVVVLRTSEKQPFRRDGVCEFRFDSLQALREFLDPLHVSWQGASHTMRQLDQSGWSPDWLG